MKQNATCKNCGCNERGGLCLHFSWWVTNKIKDAACWVPEGCLAVFGEVELGDG